jgi:hypothetical protein
MGGFFLFREMAGPIHFPARRTKKARSARAFRIAGFRGEVNVFFDNSVCF